ncbi:MAG TPA: hypothetical protein VK864_13905, partial [Longimicrobiales bacterium]|nr:hypothetical protein [Longimicrobiales bacterium]
MKNFALSLLLILAAGAGRTAAQTPTLRVAGAAVRIQQVQAQPMVAANALLPFAARIQRDGWQARVLLFGDTLTFYSGSHFLRQGNQVKQLSAPVAIHDTTV